MEGLPKLAEAYIGLLISATQTYWPDAHQPWIMAAQVEKETCITLTHKRCWSPRAELKTSRENGVGFGQVTRAFRADGSVRFDKLAELRAAHREALKDWSWENRYDPVMQMRGLVLMNKTLYSRLRPLAATPQDAWRFTLSAYNGGESGVMKSIITCRSRPGCNPSVWYGNVEVTLNKSRKPWKGYGQSAYEINTGYVRRIEFRAPRYKPAWMLYGPRN